MKTQTIFYMHIFAIRFAREGQRSDRGIARLLREDAHSRLWKYVAKATELCVCSIRRGMESFSKSLLYMSTSSLSKHIKALEKELGKPLFKRISRLVELTRFGSDFLPYAMKMVELQRECTDKLLMRPEEVSNVITIGVSFKVTVYNLMTLMPTLKKNNPNHRIQIIEQDARQLTSMQKKDEVDMVITEFYEGIDVENSGEIQSESFLADRLIVVLPANHPLAGFDGCKRMMDQMKGPRSKTVREVPGVSFSGCP